MHTLSEILEDSIKLSEDEAKLRHAMRCSPFIQRLLFSDAALLPALLENLHESWTEQAMRDWLSGQKVVDEAGLKRILRKLRQQVVLRTIARDLNGLADLGEVMRCMTTLAEVAVQYALQHLSRWQQVIDGIPLGELGSRQELIVVGMGKLGGGELNVSSDIDLIFAFEEDGSTNGDQPLSNFDYFTRLCKKLIAAINEITEDGFVFRVDMRLRPYGSEGALACSFAMLEEYYQNQGREWERYAWIKGRVIAGLSKNMDKLLRPFIFRKYLDYGAIASMRDLKVQIERDVNRREMQDNIKLGRGGIREVEFIAQVFQLIRGGRDASLQIRSTLKVLQLLQEKTLLPQSAVNELSAAYVFLRNLEHRLQYVEDAQTHELPTTGTARARIALAMGFTDWATLKVKIDLHRGRVAQHFSAVFSDQKTSAGDDDQMAAIWQGVLSKAEAMACLQAAGYKAPEETLQRLYSLNSSARYKLLPELSRQRFDALMPMVIAQAAQQQHPETTLMRVSDLLESICRRASYLALLAEYPAALSMVIKLADASPWLAQYLTQQPILLDELLDTRNLYAEPDFAAMRKELKRRLAEVDGDIERQMDTMRHFKHAAVFRFAAKDVAGNLPLETLSDYLSAPEAGEIYARFGQRINNWLSSLTSAGMLYETDLRLRPDGASGLLVSSLEAFRDYQLNKAWVWEHQALTRARFCAGDAKIGAAFEQIRNEVIGQPQEPEKLREEVAAMRQKMHSGHPNTSGLFDLKHDSGGIVDVEFIVQFLVLAYAATYPELSTNSGNLALLQLAAKLDLIDKELSTSAQEIYRSLRLTQHKMRLNSEPCCRMNAKEINIEPVLKLWQTLFPENA